MLGSRGIWHDGWKAITTHPTIAGWGNFGDDTGSSTTSRWTAAESTTWLRGAGQAAGADQPLARRSGRQRGVPLRRPGPLEIILTPRPVLSARREPLRVLPRLRRGARVAGGQRTQPVVSIGALVDIPAPGAHGVLFAHGSRFGGHALYIKDNRLHYVYNLVGMVRRRIVATADIPTGSNLILSASFDKDGEDPPGVPVGNLSLFHGDTKVGEAEIKTQPGKFMHWPARVSASDADSGEPRNR